MISLLLLVAAIPATGAVEAERAFAARAQTGGQWTAFREYAAAEAIMFVPQPVDAQQWLAGRRDPRHSVMWWPASSYVSCDGATAVNSGPWLRNGGTSAGYFTTVWRRQADGGWKWLLDHGDGLARPRPAGGEVRPRQAHCGKLPASQPLSAEAGSGRGGSADNSLVWRWTVAADGARTLIVSLWNGSAYEQVIDDRVAGQQP